MIININNFLITINNVISIYIYLIEHNNKQEKIITIKSC